MQNHRNVLHFIAAYTDNLHLCADDRLTLLASYGVDAAVMDIFGALLNGATLCPIDVREVGLGGLRERLDRDGITVYHSTPTLFRQLGRELAGRRVPGAVRLVVLGGEEARREDFQTYRECFPPECILVNGLGPTESTVSLQHFMNRRTTLTRRSVPIGLPVARTRVSLLTAEGRPDQVYGEIAIHSQHVALGKGRTYRTGDMGRLLPDGSLEFCGRKDLQTKLQGFRVELEEVEAALSRHPAVTQAAAVVGDTLAGEKRLIAYWVAGETPGSSDELRRFLRERLPGYMIPSAFVRVEALPLTPSGKLDRRSLPDPGEPPPDRDLAPPRDDLERRLSQIWTSVLGVARVGIRDDFFHLGGHSLLALRMVAEIESGTGVRVPLGTLVEAPTIERLAEVVRAGGNRQRGRALVPIQPLGGRPPLFCVHGHVGEVLFYRDLSRRLGPAQPFYGLQAHGLVGQPAHRSVEAMAAECLREVRSIQPSGPYFIGGFCLGAIVAFEMAHQLRKQGEQVALLALFWGTARKSPIASRIRLHLGQMRDTGWRYLIDRVRHRLRSRFGRDVPAINMQAARRYVPRPYPGRMTVFLSGRDRDLAGMSADDTEVVEVPGDRDTMLQEPFVGALAERLGAILGGKR